MSTDTTESELPRGRVVAVFPPPDSVVPLPARVTLRVSTGPPICIVGGSSSEPVPERWTSIPPCSSTLSVRYSTRRSSCRTTRVAPLGVVPQRDVTKLARSVGSVCAKVVEIETANHAARIVP